MLVLQFENRLEELHGRTRDQETFQKYFWGMCTWNLLRIPRSVVPVTSILKMLERTPPLRAYGCKMTFRTASNRTRRMAVPTTPGRDRSRNCCPGCQTPWDLQPRRSRPEPIHQQRCPSSQRRIVPRRALPRRCMGGRVPREDVVMRDKSCVQDELACCSHEGSTWNCHLTSNKTTCSHCISRKF